MAVQVYRCSHCGREVLVRVAAPMSADEIARRIDEEMRPTASGRAAPNVWSDRMRDHIWLGITERGDAVPREETPASCPSCRRAMTLHATRMVE